MMHSAQMEYDHSAFLSAVAPMLSEADMSIAGAEFTLAGPPYTGYPAFSAPDSYLESIMAAGIDVLMTANNHVLDKGSKGLRRTLRLLDVLTSNRLDEDHFAPNHSLILNVKLKRKNIIIIRII